jgi:hypothetical protein
MPDRILAKWQKGEPHARWIVSGRGRQVRAHEMRRGTDGREQILHECEVHHLLARDAHDRRFPPGDDLLLRRGQAFVWRILQREGGEEILAHDAVFELGRLAQHVDQRFPVLDDERRFGRGLPAAYGEQLRKFSLSGSAHRVSRIYCKSRFISSAPASAPSPLSLAVDRRYRQRGWGARQPIADASQRNADQNSILLEIRRGVSAQSGVRSPSRDRLIIDAPLLWLVTRSGSVASGRSRMISSAL